MGKGNDPNCSAAAVMPAPDAAWEYVTPRPGRTALKELALLTGEPAAGNNWHNDHVSNEQMHDWLAANGGPLFDAAAWRETLHGYTCPRTGLTLRMPDRRPYDDSPSFDVKYGRASIYCDVMDGEAPCGDVILAVFVDRHGMIELRIGAMELRYWPHGKGRSVANNARCGRGFGSGVIGRVERLAVTHGAARMSVNAVGAGAIAWARMGFDYDVRSISEPELFDGDTRAMLADQAADDLDAMRAILTFAVARGTRNADVLAQFDAARAALDQDPITPRDVIALGADSEPIHDPTSERPLTLGRMLYRNVGFEGVKILTPSRRAARLPVDDLVANAD